MRPVLQYVTAGEGAVVGSVGGPQGGLVVDLDLDGALEEVVVRRRGYRHSGRGQGCVWRGVCGGVVWGGM